MIGTLLLLAFAAAVPASASWAGATLVSDAVLVAATGAWGVAALSTCAIWRWRSSRRRTKGSLALQVDTAGSQQGLTAVAQRYEQLVDWLRSDAEITSPDADRFDHSVVARRIARRLQAGTADTLCAPTTVLLGEFGSGKTSIGRLVQYEVAATGDLRRRIEFVQFSAWGYESSDAAISAIVERIVARVGQHVGTIGLAGLAGEYLRLVESGGGLWAGIAQVFGGPGSPTETLRRLDTVAAALNVHLVLWLDDLERFSPPTPETGEARAVDADRLEPLRAFLYLLDQLAHVSVIVASTSLRFRVDVEKIARFVERIPPVSVRDVLTVVDTFRRGCLDDPDLLDPACGGRDWLSIPEESAARDNWMRTIEAATGCLPAALARLLSNPRRLKFALRRCLETWENSRGEIDLDDALLMSAVREAAPDLFAVIADHIDDLRKGLWTGFPLDREQKAADEFYAAAERAASRVGLDGASIKTIVEFVFPATRGHSNAWVRKPQGVGNSRVGSPYWERFAAGAPVSDAWRDQKVMRAIQSWKRGESSDLISRLIDDERNSAVENLVGQFDGPQLLRLLEHVMDALPGQTTLARTPDRAPPALISVWRMMLANRPEPDALLSLLSRLIDQTVGRALANAEAMVHYFGTCSDDVPWLLPEPKSVTSKTVHDLLVAAFKREFLPDRSGRLAEALAGAQPYALLWTCWGLDAIRAGKMASALPFDGWEDVARLILSAAKAHPIEMLPQLVPFVAREEVRRGKGDDDEQLVGAFDEAQARRLFDYTPLMDLLAGTTLTTFHDERCRARYEAVREAALEQVRTRTS